MNAPSTKPALTHEQWLKVWQKAPKKLRRRWWAETDYGRKPDAELWQEIERASGCALVSCPRHEARPVPVDHAEHVQAWLNRPGGWRAMHAEERAPQEAEDNKLMGLPPPGSKRMNAPILRTLRFELLRGLSQSSPAEDGLVRYPWWHTNRSRQRARSA